MGEKVAKMGVMDMACQLTETKEAGRTKKKMDGSKSKNVRGIPNFVDANFAGTDKSKNCVLILAEGLSAMSGIVSGLSSDDRNIIGIYPLKGKLLNVRGEQLKKIMDNKEINDIVLTVSLFFYLLKVILGCFFTSKAISMFYCVCLPLTLFILSYTSISKL